MEDKDFKGTQEDIMRIAREVSRIDVGGFIARVSRIRKFTPAQSLGGGYTLRSMDRTLKLAKGLEYFKKVVAIQFSDQISDIPVDLDKSNRDPRVCPKCRGNGMKQDRDEAGAWTYKCEREHTWKGTH